MNLADQAAHAIVIAARKMGVQPISVLLRNVEPNPSKIYARNLSAALLSRLPDWDQRKALNALGLSTDERFLEAFISEIHAGHIKWIDADGFDGLFSELSDVAQPLDGEPHHGILDMIYGIEDVTG